MKNAVIGTLAVALAASIAVGVIAQASRTVNVEVRVWQDAREPGALWLSARAEGGSWADAGTAPVALDGLSDTGRYRYGDIAFALAVPPPASCEEASLAGDCATLLALRDELAGAGVLNWSAGVALADWDGVAVSGAPRRVTGLDLSDRGLSGSIPTQLGSLTKLKGLYLSRNRLTGAIPTQLGSLAKLEYLRLAGNQLSGSIPTQLGSLAKLTALRLNGNRLTGAIPTQLGRLTKLRTLALSGNALTGCVPNALWNVATSDLNSLQLSSCTKPTEIQYGQIVGEGTYYFDDYFHPYSGPYFVINVGSGRQIKWKSTFAIEADSSDDPMLLYVLSDMATGSDITYDAYSGAETHRTIISSGISGQSDENGVEIFFDSITNSARMEAIP